MSSAYGEWLERNGRNDHPMLNTLILKTVFKNLEMVKDMQACRLVCKTWNAVAIPFLRYGVNIVIHEKESNKTHTIDNFVDLFHSNPLGIPYTKFNLGPFCTTEGVGQEFLHLCGNLITEINFRSGSFNVEDISELLISTPNLKVFTVPQHLQSRSGNPVKLFPEDPKPKLKSLKKLSVVYQNRVTRVKFSPTFLEELITAAENIYSVYLRDSRGENILRCSFEVLSVIEKLGRESRIKELNISPEEILDMDLLRRMSEKRDGLMLEKLDYNADHSFDRSDRDSDDHTLLQLLSLFKKTLWNLSIRGNRTTSFQGFPTMSCLTKLGISIGNYKKFNFKLTNWNFNKIFPVLQELTLLQYMSDNELDEFFPHSDPCPTMKYFTTLMLRHSPFSMNAVTQMLHVFPNLTELAIQIKGDGVEIITLIWSQMPQLKSVHISGAAQTMDSSTDFRRYLSLDSLRRLKHIIVIECKLTWAHFEILTKDAGLVYWTLCTTPEDIASPDDD